MENTNFTTKIVETTHDLTARERIYMKDTTNAHKIDSTLDEIAEILPRRTKKSDEESSNEETAEYSTQKRKD